LEVALFAKAVVILSEAKNLATPGRKAGFFVGAEAPSQNDIPITGLSWLS
jgi:hypothetical protein